MASVFLFGDVLLTIKSARAASVLTLCFRALCRIHVWLFKKQKN